MKPLDWAALVYAAILLGLVGAAVSSLWRDVPPQPPVTPTEARRILASGCGTVHIKEIDGELYVTCTPTQTEK